MFRAVYTNKNLSVISISCVYVGVIHCLPLSLSLSLSDIKFPLPLLQAVLASMADLECGFSRELFVQWASVQRNSIILTSKPPRGTLARQLIDDLNVKSVDLTVSNG